MRLIVRLSAMMALLCSLVTLLILSGSALSFFYLSQSRTERQFAALATTLDKALDDQPPPALARWLPYALNSSGVEQLIIRRGGHIVYHYSAPADIGSPSYGQRPRRLALAHHPEYQVLASYPIVPLAEVRTPGVTAPVGAAIIAIVLALLTVVHWLRRQIRPQESLESRARRIIHGERDTVRESAGESSSLTGHAIDRLLNDLAQAREQRGRVDILIRAFAARDAKTGLSNRLFFDSQLALQLDDSQESGPYGAVLLLRSPDGEIFEGRVGKTPENDLFHLFIDGISACAKRYPDALLARYFQGDLALLLPHGSLKEAESLAAQCIGALTTLTGLPAGRRENVLNIGICLYRRGQAAVDVMEAAEQAVREAVLQGGNTWSVYGGRQPGPARGSVKWRTLLERTLSQGGPRLFIRPAFDSRGQPDHLVIINRIIDGDETVASAEFLPLYRQLGRLTDYDRLQLNRTIALLDQLPQQVLSITVSADSLMQQAFVVWLRDTLMQCGKSQRQHIMFELVEADLCQHLGQLRPALRLLTGLGCRLTVSQAGLTMVSTAYITAVPVTLLKLHPGLVRDIDRRAENRLFVQSLSEACLGTPTRVYATGVKTQSEWQTLTDHAVAGGQGDFFAPLTPLDQVVKKYSRRNA
ncbi:RNase E specificity factor CsrD [Martelella alba]|uniref:RNase E specificity factor CsrD n=1 Tax=Martelella alba TaxID=2590451 RepID=A0ABY2SM45_9HYPH|nr:RNase E specificity factor CsrD [Martelella alba]TKI06873.1 RNase E specificity factor CsrD [Martelella alba]